MAKQRIVNTKFWSDNFISDLNPLDRYLFLYFLTNEHTNIAGIYELPLKHMAIETGLEVDMLKKMIKRLSAKIVYVDGWIYIKNFQKHQAVNEFIKKGIKNALNVVPSEIMAKIKALKEKQIGPIGEPRGPELSESELESESEPNSGASPQDVVDVIDAFKGINPSYGKFFSRNNQRDAAKRLLKVHEKEKLLQVISLLPKSNSLPYFPSITSPIQLEDKWAQLEGAFKRKKVEQQEKINNVIT